MPMPYTIATKTTDWIKEERVTLTTYSQCKSFNNSTGRKLGLCFDVKGRKKIGN